ncbi:MAG TPA: carboxypeptidase-like regulatory domain-containing protein [Cyclobacteriaceae bacterium]|mgnify:CR=1 FL=1|nr:carboxypeptidase-like regulatory domain-containing protein [Cyclobacteriaceae bacterium]HRJ83015.1 carboxypeptidase-like regulatory domain-containing protein [Cyclobacteriaceae bacterium]
MSKILQLTIPKPCTENWSAFSPTKHGGFCERCRKEVVDFTTWTDEAVKDYFKTLPENTCARFRSQQLKIYALSETKPSAPRITYLSVILSAGVLLFSSRYTQAQTLPKPPVEQVRQHANINQKPVSVSPTILLNGVVTAAEDGSPLPGVNVFLKGTAKGTTTDAHGEFELALEKLTGTEVLVFSFIGLKTVEYPITSQAPESIAIKMEMDQTVLGEVVMMGGVCAQKISVRRLWWRIKGLFY